MLGDVFIMAYNRMKDAGLSAEEKRKHEVVWKKVLEAGEIPRDFGDTREEYAIKLANFNDAVGSYTRRNQAFQKLTNELTLHAIYYDKDIQRELKRIEEAKGYMPRKVLEGIGKLIREHVLDTVQPHQITKEHIGHRDTGLNYVIHPAHFVEANKGTAWDLSGGGVDTTHYFQADYVRLLDTVKGYIEKIKETADKQEKKIEAGGKIDEEDYTHFFDLKP